MLETTVIRQRISSSIAWCVVASCVLLAGVTRIPQFAIATWVVALGVLLVTNRRFHAMSEEQLVRSRAYRGVAGAVFGVALAGCVMGMLPGSSERSQLLAVFFGITAIFSYRTVVARGPKPTILLVAITSFTWAPAAMVLLVTCKCGRREANWMETASHVLLVGVLVLISGLVAISMVAFRRRISELPDMRAL